MAEAFTVGEVLNRVRNAAAREFRGPIWLVGEIRKLGDQTGTLYLDLVDPGGGRWDGGDVSMSAACFKSRWRRLRTELAEAGAEMAAGREVRLCGTVTVWDNGRVFLEVTAVDIAALVGRRAAERERIIRALAAAGLLERNSRLLMPLVPLRIGLVGSRDSDGYRDFLGVLDRSGYAFAITFLHAPVQGPAAGKCLADALAALGGVDVACLVRGGGGELDAFDAEILARAIAACPVPVLTGIGHTADRGVADATAHTAYATPTACAEALVAVVAAFDTALADRAARLAGAGTAHLARHADKLGGTAADLARRARREMDASALELSRKAARLSPTNVADRLEARGERLADDAARLLLGARRTVAEAQRARVGQRTQLRAHAPERVLARGYSLTRTAIGGLVADAAALTPGDVINTTFIAGSATSTVTGTVPAAAPAATPIPAQEEPT